VPPMGLMHVATRRRCCGAPRAGGGTRTHDLTITNRLRFQLRHTGVHATLPPVLCRPGYDGPPDRGSLLRARCIGRLDPAMGLTDQDRQILDFEESWWTRPEAKASGIRHRLGMSPTGYYRRLSELVEASEALEHAPLVVRRLRRRRLDQRRSRFETTAAPHHPRR
jgi:Protein of unknown function (DUF3263)